jgi:hypothetical protein
MNNKDKNSKDRNQFTWRNKDKNIKKKSHWDNFYTFKI